MSRVAAVTDAAKGWAFVAVQGILLVLLVVLPSADHWPTPTPVRRLGDVLFVGGLLLVAAASLRLGRSLTPTPVPNQSGGLTTTGLYRFARHPIYTGVLALVIGLTVRSGNVLCLVVGLVLIAFFNVKARWEEDRLALAYDDYKAYADRTPRFIPRPRRG